MGRYCAAAVLFAWVMWEYSAILQKGPQSEAAHYVNAYYFKWTCKLASYWEARDFAKQPGATHMGWSSVHIDRPGVPSELHEFICVPDVVDPQKLRLWR